ncbi:TetR/AcrR family transcriptional regulator [Caballeronia ptereochthonis]|uniref:TetR family transcriptional regulator n=1 Tax=Caballeronia ptereochthonis TaxID=1777144 RepID=A0A158DE60_9BURK|nr:TetR/AcrR family transcriptional regulator [Caballeronia ptereochthonis]SAK92879.1 TetR family transcriptional regulator [Caballeronia ptereochthonis]
MSEQRVKRDPEGTRRRILDAAADQFSTLGLAGARVDAIASAAGTNERMLYYYFQSKEGLYVAVLEAMYAHFADQEGQLDLADLVPADAMRTLVLSIWAHLRNNPRWLSLINNENLHQGRYLERSSKLRETISPVVELVRSTLARGTATGEFREGVDPLDFYVTVVGMGYYVVSNRFTIEAFTGRNYAEQVNHESISSMHVDMLLTYLRTPAQPNAQSRESE